MSLQGHQISPQLVRQYTGLLRIVLNYARHLHIAYDLAFLRGARGWYFMFHEQIVSANDWVAETSFKLCLARANVKARPAGDDMTIIILSSLFIVSRLSTYCWLYSKDSITDLTINCQVWYLNETLPRKTTCSHLSRAKRNNSCAGGWQNWTELPTPVYQHRKIPNFFSNLYLQITIDSNNVMNNRFDSFPRQRFLVGLRPQRFRLITYKSRIS